MKSKTLKIATIMTLLIAGMAHGSAASAGTATPTYISPGIGTLMMGWLFQQR
jgi:hypothetical protein